MVSVIILTHNEEHDLPACLASLRWCDDVHVVDSGSSDRTVEIARSAGARVSVNRFQSFGQQRNWALDHCAPRHDWILFLDADERSTEEFRSDLQSAVVSAAPDLAGYYCCWKMMLHERWLKQCDSFPKWQLRLLRQGRARFMDFGHGQKEAEVQGRLAYLRAPYLHFAFSKGWSHWVARHNRYSDLEAAERAAAPIVWVNLFSPHGSVRNAALKPLVSRLPFWPALFFLIKYVLKLGFLEGREGFVYCLNLAHYEFLIRIKMDEIRQQREGRP